MSARRQEEPHHQPVPSAAGEPDDDQSDGGTSARDSVVDQYYAAFNARDFDAWLETLDEDVEVLIDSGVFRGRLVAHAYLSGIVRAYPGVTVADRRVVAQSAAAVVSEFRLVNPTSELVQDLSNPDRPGVPWRLDGVTCEVLRLRGGRISSLHSYYSPTPTDRTPVAEVPSRAEAARIAHRHAALGRVATHVAGGGSEQDLVAMMNQVIAEFAGVDVNLMLRFEEDDTAVLVAASGLAAEVAILGRRFEVGEDILAVRAGRRALRFGARGWPLPGPAGEPGATGQVQWCVGVPIILRGKVWGVSLLGSAPDEPFADDTESGITAFVELASTALANAQATDELTERAREQSELRRVAEIAAAGADPAEVFSAVTRSASAVVGGHPTVLVRFADGDMADALAYTGIDIPSPGNRFRIDHGGVAAEVQRTGRPARIDQYLTAPANTKADEWGFRASVGVPVAVGGQLWGMLCTSSTSGPLPVHTEDRLSQFVGTVAAAIAGTQARAELLALADEQAALRRVAELAAHNASAEDVLQAVATEAAALTGVEFTALLRFEPDGSSKIVALDGAPDGVVVGMSSPGTGDGAAQRVWRTGEPVRIDNLAEMPGVWPQLAYSHGYDASAAVPIVIRGELWGALVGVGRREAFPRPIEQHLANFAELAGTAVSAADARQELRLLANEQAALRRVAELVARGAALDEVFAAAATEASTLLGNLAAALVRYDGDIAVVVAVSNSPAPLGLGVAINDSNDFGVIRRTGKPARTDNFAGTSLSEIATTLGVAAGVAVPVTVEGRVWGALTASTRDATLPTGSEERLTPFAELVAAAIGNAENKAKLTASRARVVATADETRRRLQRDVHDGAQQRLVHTIIALKLARDALSPTDPAAALLQEGLSNAERANSELRDIVRGILPASLTHGGLRSGLESMVADLALPVDLTVVAPRLPAAIETTAYFVVAEAITNVVKHARASRAAVQVRVDEETLIIEVRDDGVGGVDPAIGTGLTGLFDRVEASDGTLTVTSIPGAGTTIHAAIPVRALVAADHLKDVSLSP